MKVLKRIDGALNSVEGALVIALLAAMIVLAFLQVVLRNVFASGILWVDILLRHVVLWIGFLGAALATSQERHIAIDALTRFLPGRLRSATRVLTNLFAAFVCFFLLSASLTFIEFEMEGVGTLFAEIPTWYGQLIIPVGFGLLTVHFLIRVALDAYDTLRKETA